MRWHSPPASLASCVTTEQSGRERENGLGFWCWRHFDVVVSDDKTSYDQSFSASDSTTLGVLATLKTSCHGPLAGWVDFIQHTQHIIFLIPKFVLFKASSY
jgi:hypothetical protein